MVWMRAGDITVLVGSAGANCSVNSYTRRAYCILEANTMPNCARCGKPNADVLVPQKGGDRYTHETSLECERAKAANSFHVAG